MGELVGKGDLHDHLNSTRIVTLTMTEIFIRPPKITRKMSMDTIWNRQSSHTNCMLQKKEGVELISDHLTLACVTGVATPGLNRRSWLATSMAALGGVAIASCPCCSNSSSSAWAAEDWEYGQPCGPKQWGGTCASGRHQSPIDVPLKQVLTGEGLGELVFDYNPGVSEFVNTGHGTMQVSLQILW